MKTVAFVLWSVIFIKTFPLGIFKQLRAQKMAMYPETGKQSFIRYPDHEDVYFSVVSEKRSPDLVTIFEMAIKDPKIRIGLKNGDFIKFQITDYLQDNTYQVMFINKEGKQVIVLKSLPTPALLGFNSILIKNSILFFSSHCCCCSKPATHSIRITFI